MILLESTIRLANLLQKTNLSLNIIWDFSVQIEIQYHDEDILSKVTALEEKTQIQNSEIIYENISANNLKTASEILIYFKAEIKSDITKGSF